MGDGRRHILGRQAGPAQDFDEEGRRQIEAEPGKPGGYIQHAPVKLPSLTAKWAAPEKNSMFKNPVTKLATGSVLDLWGKPEKSSMFDSPVTPLAGGGASASTMPDLSGVKDAAAPAAPAAAAQTAPSAPGGWMDMLAGFNPFAAVNSYREGALIGAGASILTGPGSGAASAIATAERKRMIDLGLGTDEDGNPLF